MNIVHILLVGAGGCIGSMARYIALVTIDRKLGSLFPYGTFTVNLIGSFLLGIFIAFMMKKTGAHLQEWRLFFATGFCGGFTTFSAFAADNFALFEHKMTGTALLYISLSVLGGLVAVASGFILAKNVL